MKILCQHCGCWTDIHISGRRRLDLDGNKVLASLQASGSVTLTAREYGVTRGSIRNCLKAIGTTAAESSKGQGGGMRRLALVAVTVLSWVYGVLHAVDKWLGGLIDAWLEKLFEDGK